MNPYRTMKELPLSERPHEKCMSLGAEALSDAELLAVILRCGSPGETVQDLAVRLMCMLEPKGGLRALGSISLKELEECRGIGSVKAVQLRCMVELGRRLARQECAAKLRMRDPGSIADYFMSDMSSEQQETVVAAFFDTRCHLIHHQVIFRGTVNSSVVSPREVFLEALKYRAVYVVLLHNHPSGDPEPSEEDLAMTQRMEGAGKLLSIPLIDHIIIGDNCYISLKEQGMIL